MKMGDNRHTIFFDAVLPVIDTVGRACPVERVGPVQIGIYRKQMILTLEFIFPTDNSFVCSARLPKELIT